MTLQGDFPEAIDEACRIAGMVQWLTGEISFGHYLQLLARSRWSLGRL
jgi:hypothetical protein